MKITNIRISNYKGFGGDVNISLAPNNNGMENELKSGYYKKIGNKFIPNVVGFIGRNGIGKTTIIDAVTLVDKIFTQGGYQREVVRGLVSEKIFTDLNDEQSGSIYFSEITDKMSKIEKELSTIEPEKYINLFEEYTSKKYVKLAHRRNKAIFIEIVFENNNNKMRFVLKHSKSKINMEAYVNGVKMEQPGMTYRKEIGNSISIYEIKTELKIDNWLKNKLSSGSIDKFLNLVGEDLFNGYLRIADPNINRAIITKRKTILSVSLIEMEDGDNVEITDLSLGTKKLLDLASFIETSSKDSKTPIVFIDEINTNLHTSLVNTLFRRATQIDTNKSFQLFFTTHSPILMDKITYKQGFLIDKDIDETFVKKISSFQEMRNGSSFVSKYIKERISSHPSSSRINKFLVKADEWKQKS